MRSSRDSHNISRYISRGAILTTLAVLFQSAPLFLPVLGLALSPLSTLPIAIAAISKISLGLAVFFSTALILTFVSVQEAIILTFSTGLLGVVIGSFLHRKGIIISILYSSITLTLGMILLTYLVGVSGFVELTNSISTTLTILIFFLFSLVYASIWNVCIKKFMDYLKKAFRLF